MICFFKYVGSTREKKNVIFLVRNVHGQFQSKKILFFKVLKIFVTFHQKIMIWKTWSKMFIESKETSVAVWQSRIFASKTQCELKKFIIEKFTVSLMENRNRNSEIGLKSFFLCLKFFFSEKIIAYRSARKMRWWRLSIGECYLFYVKYLLNFFLINLGNRLEWTLSIWEQMNTNGPEWT